MAEMNDHQEDTALYQNIPEMFTLLCFRDKQGEMLITIGLHFDICCVRGLSLTMNRLERHLDLAALGSK